MPTLEGHLRQRQIIIPVSVFRRGQTSYGPGLGKELRGLVDTGAQASGVSEKSAREIGLTPIGARLDSWAMALGKRRLPRCLASFGIHFPGEKAPEFLRRIPVEPTIIEELNNQPFEVLIGMDVLEKYKLCVAEGKFKLWE